MTPRKATMLTDNAIIAANTGSRKIRTLTMLHKSIIISDYIERI